MGRKSLGLSAKPDGTDVWTTVDAPDLLPWLAQVKVAHVDGVPRIIGLRLDPRYGDLSGDLRVRDFVVTADALRRLPLTELREAGLRMQRLELHEALDVLGAPGKAAGQRSWGDDHYERVARAYRAAEEAGQAPRLVIAERWQVEPPTVSRWLAKARRRGHLEPYSRAAGRAAATGTGQ